MPLANTDLKFYLSGGSSNTLPSASLGGAISTTELGTGAGAMFDNVDGDEALAGDIEYRCFYVKNTHSTLTAQTPRLWIPANTPSASTAVEIGVGTAAVSGTEQTVANENTAPSGVTFAPAATAPAGPATANLAPGETRSFWVKRTVSSGAAATTDNGDGCTVAFKFDTAA